MQLRASQGAGTSVPETSQDPLGQGVVVGALDNTANQVALHAPGANAMIQRNPDNPVKVATSMPEEDYQRMLRARVNVARPLNNDPGVGVDAPTGYSWMIGGGGGPGGAPAPIQYDEAHEGYDPVFGTNSDLVGVGPLNPGAYGSMAPRPNDAQAHEVHISTDYSDPRHDFGGYPSTFPSMDVSASEVVSTPDEIVRLNNNQGIYIRPETQFFGGRPSRKPDWNWSFWRPFDQLISQRMTGQRVRPTSPPDVSGSQLDPRGGIHASMPIRDNTNAPEGNDGYSGSFFGPAGMQPIQAQRNSWRAQPTPWDANLVNSEGGYGQ